jgi:hypothetical protein
MERMTTLMVHLERDPVDDNCQIEAAAAVDVVAAAVSDQPERSHFSDSVGTTLRSGLAGNSNSFDFLKSV